ncbi:Crp/Fnr family transcriptional regulator [Desulfofustis glycolicus]|uniref:Cyclic nucleotide-binding domain-containing protein n=1 Tax=Desulfofustis glycolicus DSM 9705 TaxID=1121409 RepID=A0A1M5XXQ2_9BACT|nr:cyclic nucleotide-binding domain-containing protein [Desulfofustis glycolicus]MCB2215469.1 cyclic nucleotide-binding domain-containing protein [Desulfobulbaceae bacterium]SHI04516.1 Cyclic nucleotide-binding domain-containing protein [Desulfofustis glycolicus DSM 9705]
MVWLKELETTSVFRGLNDQQLETLSALCTMESYKRDDCLFKEGEPAEHMWIVTEGQVDLRFELPGNRTSSAENTVSSFTAQEDRKRVLGWSCFVPPYRMTLSAYCVSRTCSVIKIGRADLLETFEQDMAMGYKVMSYLIKVVGYRFQQFQEELVKVQGRDIMHSW